MRIGVFLLAPQFPDQSHGTVLDGTMAAALAAEEAGFDDVWLAEHHFMSYGVCPQAATLAGFVLGATRHIHVGTAVSVLSTQHPVALAEQAALLDQVSGGRFRLGVGRGGPWVDLEVFGTGEERYTGDMAEALDLLIAWLSQERVAGTGPRFAFRPVDIVPRPRTRPLPTVLACTTPPTEALAAERGLPMLLGMHVGDHERAASVARYARVASANGRPAHPSHVAAALAYVGDSRAEAERLVTTELPRWLGPGLASHVRLDGGPAPDRDPDAYTRLLCDLHPVGSPDDCVRAMVTTMRHTGVRHLILMVEGTGDRNRTLENIARLGAEVLPRVRAWGDRDSDPATPRSTHDPATADDPAATLSSPPAQEIG